MVRFGTTLNKIVKTELANLLKYIITTSIQKDVTVVDPIIITHRLSTDNSVKLV